MCSMSILGITINSATTTAIIINNNNNNNKIIDDMGDSFCRFYGSIQEQFFKNQERGQEPRTQYMRSMGGDGGDWLD